MKLPLRYEKPCAVTAGEHTGGSPGARPVLKWTQELAPSHALVLSPCLQTVTSLNSVLGESSPGILKW